VLIGRDQELALLRERLGRGMAVAVVGEAGIGKTALLREACASIGRPVFEGGALSSLSWMPYLPIERAFGVPMAMALEDPEGVAADIRHRLGSGTLVLDDLQWADRETLTVVPLLTGSVALLMAIRPDDPGTGPNSRRRLSARCLRRRRGTRSCSRSSRAPAPPRRGGAVSHWLVERTSTRPGRRGSHRATGAVGPPSVSNSTAPG